MNNKLVLLAFLFIGNLILVSQAFQSINKSNFKKVFLSAKPYADLSSALYSIKGLKLLGENIDNSAEICSFVKSKLDTSSLESIYLSNEISNEITNCQLDIQDLPQLVKLAASSQNIVDLYHYTNLAKSIKQEIDAVSLSKSLVDILKRDTSIMTQAYSLQIALALPESDKTFYENIETIVEQADEIDSIYLQFEGGASTTAFVLDGIFKLSEKFNKLPEVMNVDRIAKFVNYISSKRYPTQVKAAYNILSIAIKLTDNQFAIPVIINRHSSISVTQDKPNVLVTVSNILGRPVGQDIKFQIEVDSSNNQQSNLPPLLTEKRQFQAKSSDGTLYELRLHDSTTENQAGFYTIVLNVKSTVADKRLIVLNNRFEVKFLRDLEVTDLQIGVADREQTQPALKQVKSAPKITLNGDQNSKVYIRFGIKEKISGKFTDANQVFVKFSKANSDREIIFLAEQSASSKQYSCDVDLFNYQKNFANLNGVFSIQLIVTDPLASTPQILSLADIKLQFADGVDEIPAKAQLYAKKPEIKHLFREPEQRPSKLVSTVFSALCLVPILILVILWFNIGFNLSRFEISIPSIVFHVSLAGIFGIFYCYWAYLNMFQALRWLGVLSIAAFLSGKQVLSNLAASPQKEKTN